MGDAQGILKSDHYYIDEEMNFIAGAVSGPGHEWLVNEVTFEVFLQVDNGCLTRLIQQDLDNTVILGCELIPTADKVLNYDPIDPSLGWFYPYNWDGNQVPTFCSDVDIDSPHTIILDPAFRGKGRTLDVELGAVLDVSGELRIEDLLPSPPTN